MVQVALIVAAVLAGLVFWWYVAPDERLVQPKGAEQVEQQAPLQTTSRPDTNDPLPPKQGPSAEDQLPPGVLLGAPDRVEYFNEQELLSLGLERTVDQVRYLAGLDLELLIKGKSYPHDNIASIDEPRFVGIDAADDWLADGELVIGVQLNGVVRAYPLAILGWHEIVNDRFGEIPVTVTYCSLCLSSIVFEAPVIDGQPVTFGNSGRLYKADLVMYDRPTATLWSQFEGRPIVGPLVGKVEPLKRIPADVVPYGTWKISHPDAQVLDRPRVGDRLGNRIETREFADGFPRNYAQDPIEQYRQWNTPLGEADPFGVVFEDERLKSKDEVIGVVVGGQPKAYVPSKVYQAQVVNDEVGGVPVLVVVTPDWGIRFFERLLPDSIQVPDFSLKNGNLVDDAGNTWDYEGRALAGPFQGVLLKQVPATRSFWFAWTAFHPDTELFDASVAD